MLVGAGPRHRVVVCLGDIMAAVMIATAVIAISSVGGAHVAAAFTCSSGGATYEVRSGDGWYVISGRADVTVSDLLAANDATLDAILVPGDQLCLPAGADLLGACPSRATVHDGDGWATIAGRAGVSVAAILAANAASIDRTIYPGEQLCVPAGASGSSLRSGSNGTATATGGESYTVRNGDSWALIASRAGVSLGLLLSQNGADVETVIHPGALRQDDPVARMDHGLDIGTVL